MAWAGIGWDGMDAMGGLSRRGRGARLGWRNTSAPRTGHERSPGRSWVSSHLSRRSVDDVQESSTHLLPPLNFPLITRLSCSLFCWELDVERKVCCASSLLSRTPHRPPRRPASHHPRQPGSAAQTLAEGMTTSLTRAIFQFSKFPR